MNATLRRHAEISIFTTEPPPELASGTTNTKGFFARRGRDRGRINTVLTDRVGLPLLDNSGLYEYYIICVAYGF